MGVEGVSGIVEAPHIPDDRLAVPVDYDPECLARAIKLIASEGVDDEARIAAHSVMSRALRSRRIVGGKSVYEYLCPAPDCNAGCTLSEKDGEAGWSVSPLPVPLPAPYRAGSLALYICKSDPIEQDHR